MTENGDIFSCNRLVLATPPNMTSKPTQSLSHSVRVDQILYNKFGQVLQPNYSHKSVLFSLERKSLQLSLLNYNTCIYICIIYICMYDQKQHLLQGVYCTPMQKQDLQDFKINILNPKVVSLMSKEIINRRFMDLSLICQ